MATARRTFGESGERFTAIVKIRQPIASELLARVILRRIQRCQQSNDAGVQSRTWDLQGPRRWVAGWRKNTPGNWEECGDGAANGEGLDEAAIRTWETLNLGDEDKADADAGFAENSPNTVVAALPSASVGWHLNVSAVRRACCRGGAELDAQYVHSQRDWPLTGMHQRVRVGTAHRDSR